VLYFAYTARIEPDAMAQACPSAQFAFIAHLPDRHLRFPLEGNGWSGGLPTAIPASGSTVWGAVYEIPDRDASELDAIEGSEGRIASMTHAVDRMGRRHAVTTHVAADADAPDLEPSVAYVGMMLRGSRHWSLPAGWIAGLEDVLAPNR
jgi:gamma-glutamylcyclotransferase (GGCT)/AIG2-like uncharacterized protein YtfP